MGGLAGARNIKAVHVEQLFQIGSFLLVGIFFGADLIFGFLGTIATLAVIVLYIMANIALTTFVRREHGADFNILRHVIVPLVGTLLLIPVLYVTVYPVPAYPINLTPYIFIVMLIIGFVAMLEPVSNSSSKGGKMKDDSFTKPLSDRCERRRMGLRCSLLDVVARRCGATHVWSARSV